MSDMPHHAILRELTCIDQGAQSFISELYFGLGTVDALTKRRQLASQAQSLRKLIDSLSNEIGLQEAQLPPLETLLQLLRHSADLSTGDKSALRRQVGETLGAPAGADSSLDHLSERGEEELRQHRVRISDYEREKLDAEKALSRIKSELVRMAIDEVLADRVLALAKTLPNTIDMVHQLALRVDDLRGYASRNEVEEERTDLEKRLHDVAITLNDTVDKAEDLSVRVRSILM